MERWGGTVSRRRFVRICPDFRRFGGCGRIEGRYKLLGGNRVGFQIDADRGGGDVLPGFSDFF